MIRETKICCVSVLGGWQSAVEGQHVTYAFGPVFNNIQDLWNWQKENI